MSKPPPRRSDVPEPGWYLLRLVRGGVWVGAQIAYNEAEGWTVVLDGVLEGPNHNPWALPSMERVHWGGRPTTEAEVLYRIGIKRFAEIHMPAHPAVNPKQPVDIDELPPVI
jgi:hypothetical protein